METEVLVTGMTIDSGYGTATIHITRVRRHPASSALQSRHVPYDLPPDMRAALIEWLDIKPKET